MKLRNVAIGAVLALATSSSANAAVVLDFEGIANSSFVLSYYNGGTDLFGNRGPNLGVTMGLNAPGMIAFIDRDSGGTADVANEPSGKTVMSLIGGDRVTLNYAAGFEGAFSVAYSARRASSVRIYDGLNGSGNVLATIQLGAQWDSECGGDPNGEFCNWTTAMASFSGVGKSVDFFGSPGDIYFDDVALGATAVPEPATWAMMITGFGLTGAAVRRRRFSLAA